MDISACNHDKTKDSSDAAKHKIVVIEAEAQRRVFYANKPMAQTRTV